MTEKHDASTQSTPSGGLSRRDVLKLGFVAIGGVVTLEVGGMLLSYLQPRQGEGEFGGMITAGKVDDFPPGTVTHVLKGRFYLSRLPDGGFLALYQRCTHLGCTVPWNAEEGKFVCPCHNSQFATSGEVLNPPAPRPLDIFPVVIQDGEVLVDTGHPIQRERFEPSQVVYQ